MRKEVFNLVALRGIYLPSYQLNIAVEMLETLTKVVGGVQALNELESFVDREFKSYDDKLKGAYTIDKMHCNIVSTIAKKIVATSIQTGEEKEFDSIYQAAVEITGSKNGTGNISQVINGKKKTCYGYVFRKKM